MTPNKHNMYSFSRGKALGPVSVGSMRCLADKRQMAGLLMVTGLCAVMMPLYQIASVIEANGKTVTTGIEFANLLGSNIVAATGFVSVLVGYAETVHDTGHTRATLVAILLSQAVWIPYISGMVGIGIAASTGDAFIPKGYTYTADDVGFIGAMGILGVASYGFSLVGAIAFFQFALYAFQAGKAVHRHASYFRSRQRFYSFILYVAGINQFTLGAYCCSRFGTSLIDHGPIIVGFYVVSYPILSVLVGLLQTLLGCWCFARSYGYVLQPGKEHFFTMSMGLAWFLQLVLQVLAQIGVSSGSGIAGLAASVAAFGFGLNLMPAFLDYKTRTTPEVIDPDYYGLQFPSESTKMTGWSDDSLSDIDVEDPRIISQSPATRKSTTSSQVKTDSTNTVATQCVTPPRVV